MPSKAHKAVQAEIEWQADQAEYVQAEEAAFLEDATDYRDFRERRELMRSLTVMDDIPLGETTYRDYCKLRTHQKAQAKPKKIEVGEMSIYQYNQAQGK